jgi:hypothetical protein
VEKSAGDSSAFLLLSGALISTKLTSSQITNEVIEIVMNPSSENRRSLKDRRSGRDRRQCYDLDYEGRRRRSGRYRRSREERRKRRV